MRPTSSLLYSALALSLLGACVGACASDDEPAQGDDPPGVAGQGGDGGTDAGAGGSAAGGAAGSLGGVSGAGGAGGTGGAPVPGVPGMTFPACAPMPVDGPEFAPLQASRLAPGSTTPLGITSDDVVVYREGSKMLAARLGAAPAAPSVITEQPGTALFRGKVVFAWSNVNYDTGEADLLAWTGPDCARPVGRTLASDDLIAASDDGSVLLFPANVTKSTMDLEVAARDLSWRHILITGVGRASDTTCRPHYGFAGGRVVVGHCAPGSQNATLETFEGSGNTWQKTSIAKDTQPTWSADAKGESLFYTTAGGSGRLWRGQDMGEVDAGIVWGQLLPDASGMLYTVGDQLRRSAPPDFFAVAVVVNKFRRALRWSDDYASVLYATELVYEGGERHDLLLAQTGTANGVPRKLSPTVDATLSRDAFSADGKFVAYLTGVNAGAGTLHLAPVAAGAERTAVGVNTVAAAHDGLFVYSDNVSAPNVYPATADLKVWNAAGAGGPLTLRSKIVDGRNFYVAPGGRAVVYQRLADPQEANSEGLWVAPLTPPAAR